MQVTRNPKLAIGFALVVLLEIVLIAMLFFEYSDSWKDASVFFVLVLLPPLYITLRTWKKLRNRTSKIPKILRLLFIGSVIGFGGISIAYALGPHLAGSILICAIYFQALLNWLASVENEDVT